VTRTGAGVLGALALIALPILWFYQLSPTSWHPCTTPRWMAQAIDARMRSPRVHVDHVRVIEVHDPSYENLFIVSARVRARAAFVGIGTWSSNFSDLGPGFDWSRAPDYVSLTPVNDLARTVSTPHGVGRSPSMTQAAKYSQRCAASAAPA
jgi:hypothetical protein